MAEWTRNASVAAFVLVLGGALAGLYGYFGKGRFGPKGIVVHATLRDATGLAPLGRVSTAGIAIGSIKSISLTPEGKARVDVQINPGVVLHRDASVAKQTSSLLGEPYLGVTPGAQGSPVLGDGDEIANVIEPVGMEQVIERVGELTSNVNAVAKTMANSLGTQESERQMKAILANVEQATATLNLIVSENRQALRSTFSTIEELSRETKPRAAKILKNVEESTERLNNVVSENRDDVRGTVKGAREAVEGAKRATVPLESALQHIDSITAAIDRGKGNVGRLVRDESLIDEVQGAAEGVNDLVGGVSRLQTIVALRSDYNFLSNTIKSYVEVRLQPREDKYYLVELVNDPRGKTTIEQTDVDTTNPNQPSHYREVRTSTVNALRFSLQFARRLGPFTGRFGLKESTGGFGLNTHLFDDRLELQQDFFGFGEQLVPRWRVALSYEFIKRLWLLGGVDNLLSVDRRDYFVGLTLKFNDDDLKSMLLFLPKPQ